jgi:hypothetical protein
MNKNIYLFKIFIASTLISLSSSVYSQSKPDSITIAIEPTYDKVSKAHRLFLGESYRKLWATPVKMRVFHLAKEKGGLKILQRGGGMQTKSLRLEDANGKEWVIRTIQKYPEKVLPPTLRETVAATIIQDQISAEHPFSAITVPPLAQALGVPHANPEIVYIPDDPAFGEYQKDFANQVFLFEEREPLDAKKTDNTLKAQEKLQEDNDNSVNQTTVLKARLLDMLLGDWDRHEDQWRWERTKGKNGTVYEPVPRDRDQVFYSTSVVVPWLVSRYILMSKFQSYEDHIRSINRWNLNARYFDRYFLNGLNQQDWETQIDLVQKTLTDELITKSVKLMPADIYKLCGPEITKKLIARRNMLKTQALKYYRFLSNTVEIPGTDKREHIDITNEPGGKVSVKINKLKKEGDQEQVIYQRTFDPKDTKELRLYGLASEDVFAIHGNNHSPIKLRLIGGDDEDTFLIDSDVQGKGNRYIYDRADEKNKLPTPVQARLLTGTDTMVNNYNKTSFKYNFFEPLLLASYNKDYGFQLIGNFVYQKQGFRKEPYAFKQTLNVNYGFGNNSLLTVYTGDFKKAIGNNDLVISALNKGPNYTSNFFGVGNNTEFANTPGRRLQYYQNIYNYTDVDVRLKHTYNNWEVTGGITAQYYNGDEDDNNNRFLNSYNVFHPNERVFSAQTNAGLVAGFTLDTRDKSFVPHNGVYWHTNLIGVKAINSNAHSYGQIQSEFSFYLAPKDSTFVVAVRTGGGTTFGNASYYQQLKLGGNQNLRGFFISRFTGKSMAFNNIELRLKLVDFASYILPGTLGLIGFNDIGRVWTPDETSSQWHDGYGGGFFFLPAQLILIQGVVGFSKEGAYPYISAGFRF